MKTKLVYFENFLASTDENRSSQIEKTIWFVLLREV